jgi:hypothetical protein
VAIPCNRMASSFSSVCSTSTASSSAATRVDAFRGLVGGFPGRSAKRGGPAPLGAARP